VVVNVGPIGCIPYLRDIMTTGAGAGAGTPCAELPNQLAQSFNRKLRALVSELGASLGGSRFLYADVYRIFSDIIANYKSHGTARPRTSAVVASAPCELITRWRIKCV
jgi:phospholipase/lecithinase/hemolysin